MENLVSQHEVGVDVHGPSLTLTWCVLDLILEVGVWLDTWSGCGGEILVCRTWCSQHPLPLICHPSLQGGSCGEDSAPDLWIVEVSPKWNAGVSWEPDCRLQWSPVTNARCLRCTSNYLTIELQLTAGIIWASVTFDACRVVLSCNFICYNHQRKPNIKQQQYYQNVFTNPIHMRENLFSIQCSEWGVDSEKGSKKGRTG